MENDEEFCFEREEENLVKRESVIQEVLIMHLDKNSSRA